MPVITLYEDRFSSFIGKPVSVKYMSEWLPWLGIDIEDIGPNYVKVEFNPCRVDFSGYSGLARAFRGLMGWDTGLPRYKIQKGRISLNVDPGVSNVRPYILAAVIRDLEIDEESIEEIMKIQEDIHWGVGRDRKKASIGVHNLDSVQPPFTYTTGDPNTVRFTTLDRGKMSLQEILDKHKKGVKYRNLVDFAREYPIILDSKKRVLSFPPIINSELTSVNSLTKNLFIDVTGLEPFAVSKSLNILVTALAEMDGCIENVRVVYPDRVITSPDLAPQKATIRVGYVNELLGLDLSESEVIQSLRKCRLDAKKLEDGVLAVSVPAYRIDIMHEVDLVEEVAIGYGFFRLKPTKPVTITSGKMHKVSELSDYVRQVMIGLGFVEVLNFVLTNEAVHYTKMRLKLKKVIKLANPVSTEYNVVRQNSLSSLMKNLSDNRHENYPQRIFEVSDVIKINLKTETRAERRIHITGALCHSTANFTEMKSCVKALLDNLGVIDWKVKETRHPSFIPGRVVKIVYKSKSVGVLGEIHPEVLNNFELTNPTCGFEIDLKEFLDLIISP